MGIGREVGEGEWGGGGDRELERRGKGRRERSVSPLQSKAAFLMVRVGVNQLLRRQVFLKKC